MYYKILAIILLYFQVFTVSVYSKDLSAAAALTAPKKQVLVLHSYHKGLTWTNAIAQGVDKTLNEAFSQVEIMHEFMDTKRIYDNGHLQNLRKLYRHKYKNRKLDLIITSDDHAFQFILSQKKSLFPGVPAVFCGVNQFEDEFLRDHKLVTGVVEDIDMKSTIEIAQKLHPGTKYIYAITDRTLSGTKNTDRLKKLIPYLKKGTVVRFIEASNVSKLRKDLSSIPPNSIALWLHFTRDDTGRTYSFGESTYLIATSCPVPLYSFWDFSLGHGIVGGRLTSGIAQGSKAAELGVRIIRGEKPGNIAVVKESPNVYMFDYAQLVMFNVNRSALPEDSQIINLPESFVAKYPRIFWSIIISSVFIAMIFVFMFIYIKLKRESAGKLMESEARYRGIFDYGINGIMILRHSHEKDDFKIINCNEAAETIDDFSIDDIKNSMLTEVYPPIRDYDIFRAFERVWEKGEPEHFPLYYYQDERIQGWRDTYIFRLPTDDIIIIYSNETRRMEAENSFKELNRSLENKVAERTEELEQSNQALKDSIDQLSMAQDQLVQAEKMAALGGLVAGVAHEINTPLGVSVTAASFINNKVSDFSEKYNSEDLSRSDMENFIEHLNETMSILNHNLKRASSLIDSFKQVSVDQSSEERRRFIVKDYLDKILLSLKPKYKKYGHNIRVDCPGDLEINSYPGAYSQIVTNLLVNSIVHAFEEESKGDITIKIVPDNKQLICTFTDNGKGMEAETREKIFDPFFTTRRTQGGTGLGLHLVFNLVTQTLKGTIKCSSKPGEGTEFVIIVPQDPPE